MSATKNVNFSSDSKRGDSRLGPSRVIKMKNINKPSISSVSHMSKRSLTGADFDNFESPSAGESPETVPSTIRDVNTLFLAKAKGRVAQSTEEQQNVKESIFPLIGQLSKFIHKKLEIIREKYQDDSDEEDVKIPKDDVELDYIK